MRSSVNIWEVNLNYIPVLECWRVGTTIIFRLIAFSGCCLYLELWALGVSFWARLGQLWLRHFARKSRKLSRTSRFLCLLLEKPEVVEFNVGKPLWGGFPQLPRNGVPSFHLGSEKFTPSCHVYKPEPHPFHTRTLLLRST